MNRLTSASWPAGIVAVILAGPAVAATKTSEHLYRLDADEPRPAATLEDVAMLIGSWQGEAFGKTFEESWSTPSNGSMVGMFKLMDGDEISFYELLLLVEEEGSVSMKVKHFNADFTAWEDKPDYVTFEFVSADDDAVHFSGLSFYRVSDDEMVGYISMRYGDEVREEKLTYKRVQP